MRIEPAEVEGRYRALVLSQGDGRDPASVFAWAKGFAREIEASTWAKLLVSKRAAASEFWLVQEWDGEGWRTCSATHTTQPVPYTREQRQRFADLHERTHFEVRPVGMRPELWRHAEAFAKSHGVGLFDAVEALCAKGLRTYLEESYPTV